jgi:hypothetical protein
MDHRATSKYATHERITWFGKGACCYVDYTTATDSFFIGTGQGRFKVIEPNRIGGKEHYFDEIDTAIEYAMARA